MQPSTMSKLIKTLQSLRLIYLKLWQKSTIWSPKFCTIKSKLTKLANFCKKEQQLKQFKLANWRISRERWMTTSRTWKTLTNKLHSWFKLTRRTPKISVIWLGNSTWLLSRPSRTLRVTRICKSSPGNFSRSKVTRYSYSQKWRGWVLPPNLLRSKLMQ